MMQVDKYFDVPFYKGELGLELEVEAKKALPRFINEMGWTSKAEGSLRGHNMEYITINPVYNNVEKRKMVEHLVNVLAPSEPIIATPRTSLHVHVNVQKFSLQQVYTAICAYWLLENLLTKFCGEEYREGNHFCLRATDAEWIVRAHINDLKTNRPFFTEMMNRNLRYGGLNTAAVPRFGSIEFRSMRGTVDPNLIDMWSSELHRLVFRTKKSFANPAEFMDRYFAFTKEELLGLLFSKDFAGELMKIDGWSDLIKENDGLVCELAYAVDWDKYEVKNPLADATARGRARPRPRRDPIEQVNELLRNHAAPPEINWGQVNMQMAQQVMEPPVEVLDEPPEDWRWMEMDEEEMV